MTWTEDAVQQLLVDACRRGEELGIMISVAVVDAGGHLLGFRRHVDAEIVSITLAEDKAYTAAINRVPTSELAVQCRPGGELYGIQHHRSGRMVIFGGGVPIRDEAGKLAGAIGVSGGTTAQDEDCSQYAIDRLERS